MGAEQLAQVAGARRVVLRRSSGSGMPDLNYDTRRSSRRRRRSRRFWLRRWASTASGSTRCRYLVEEQGTRAAHRRDAPRPPRRTALRALGEAGRRSPSARCSAHDRHRCSPYYPDQLDSYFAFEVADSIIAGVRSGSARARARPVLRLQRECAGGAVVAVPPQPRPDRARARSSAASMATGARRSGAAADDAGDAVRLLRRGDRDDRAQAGRAAAAPRCSGSLGTPPASRAARRGRRCSLTRRRPRSRRRIATRRRC